MCYNAASLTQASLKYAKHRGESPEEIAAIEQKLEQERKLLSALYFVNAFEHPPLLIFTNREPLTPQFYKWGLIPSWCKDEALAMQLSNQTINARAETMFEKPSFKNAARNKRCLIYLDAFYEYHHYKNKTYPFRIAMKDQSPMIIAGLYDEWLNQSTGEIVKTVSIVTTDGNERMRLIHNNPKGSGPRMPVILAKDNQDNWLSALQNDNDLNALEALIHPLDNDLLDYYTVRKPTGKEGIGNTPEIEDEFIYDELGTSL